MTTPTIRCYPRNSTEAFPRTVEYAAALSGPRPQSRRGRIRSALYFIAGVALFFGVPFIVAHWKH